MDTVEFSMLFTGEYRYQGPDEVNCPGLAKVISVGEGTGTHFKKLTSHLAFCVNTEDGTYPCGYMDAYFEDEHGDKLFIKIDSGQVIPGSAPGIPDYAVSHFKDEFQITGGTGKFEDATGSGVTNDYNFAVEEEGYDFPTKTSHHWKGTITLKKGK